MSRNKEYIQEAFDIFNETFDKLIFSDRLKHDKELFAKLMELNIEHLIDNLDKALKLFKEEVK